MKRCLKHPKLVVATLIGLFALFAVCTKMQHYFRSVGVTAYGSVDEEEKPLSLSSFLNDPGRISSCNIEELNLSCLEGLSEAKEDTVRYKKVLNDWANRIAAETSKNSHQFRANPAQFNYSEPYFKMLVLITVLEQDLGITYNTELMKKASLKDVSSTSFFNNPDNLFIKGIVDHKQGTCASIPVLITAIGRKLGYPLKLVPAKAHLFVRWEGINETFNIEAGGDGLKCHPDNFYHNWPFKLTESNLKSGYYLKSLTPKQELAVFLELRALCLLENSRKQEAAKAFADAFKLNPDNPELIKYVKKYSNSKSLTKI